ncbi:hypothetical protein KI387_030585, partial [Taxus chinensis]
VNVPPSSLLGQIAPVRCGHCTSIISVNLTGQLFQPPSHQQQEDISSTFENNDSPSSSTIPFGGKKQRAPSAYNRFIREEIQRIKSVNPDISHREAFGTAAKNWAYLGLMLPNTNKQVNPNQ